MYETFLKSRPYVKESIILLYFFVNFSIFVGCDSTHAAPDPEIKFQTARVPQSTIEGCQQKTASLFINDVKQLTSDSTGSVTLRVLGANFYTKVEWMRRYSDQDGPVFKLEVDQSDAFFFEKKANQSCPPNFEFYFVQGQVQYLFCAPETEGKFEMRIKQSNKNGSFVICPLVEAQVSNALGQPLSKFVWK